MKYKLDASKTVSLQISNDTFWYLYQEEEMIDDSNMEEAEEIISMFPNGFIIKDDFAVVEDQPDLIECEFIPYVEDTDITEWDGEHVICNNKGIRVDITLFKVISHSRCRIRNFNETNGKVLFEGEYDVVYYHKNPWCSIPSTTPRGAHTETLIPLWGKDVKYFTKNRF